jgi:hypothetical protein
LKKSCFLKIIIIFTIVLAAGLYLIQNKFDELFLTSGKELAISVIEEGWKNDLDFVKETHEKDSLKTMLKHFISNMKSSKNFTTKKTEFLIDYLAAAFDDSLVDADELSQIYNLITNP